MARVVDLLCMYGEKKFRDEWWPGNAEPHTGKDGAELEELLDGSYDGKVGRVIELLNAYGEAKFGGEWWPGNARPWLGEELGAELEALLGHPSPEMSRERGTGFPASVSEGTRIVRVSKRIDAPRQIMPARGVEGEYLGRDERGVAVRFRLPFPTARGGTAHPVGNSHSHLVIRIPEDAVEAVSPDADFLLPETEPAPSSPTFG